MSYFGVNEADLNGITRADRSEDVLQLGSALLHRCGFEWFCLTQNGINAGIVYAQLPTNLYEDYQAVFGEGDPVTRYASASLLPIVWDRIKIKLLSDERFDLLNDYGIEWGASFGMSVRLDRRYICSIASSIFVDEAEQYSRIKDAYFIFLAMFERLDALGYFAGVDAIDLTKEQIKILMLLSDGYRRNEIAKRLGISDRTVSRRIEDALKQTKSDDIHILINKSRYLFKRIMGRIY